MEDPFLLISLQTSILHGCCSLEGVFKQLKFIRQTTEIIIVLIETTITLNRYMNIIAEQFGSKRTIFIKYVKYGKCG